MKLTDTIFFFGTCPRMTFQKEAGSLFSGKTTPKLVDPFDWAILNQWVL